MMKPYERFGRAGHDLHVLTVHSGSPTERICMTPAVARAFRVGLTVFILVMLVVFAVNVNWRDIWAVIRTASFPLLLMAALLNLASGLIKGIRWWVFLRPIGATSMSLAIRATFAGAGLNNVLIANGGEAARVVFVARSANLDSARVVATIALERLFDAIGYVVLLALAIMFLELPPSIDRLRPFALVSLLLVAILMAWLIRRPLVMEQGAATGATSWPDRLRTHGSRFMHTIGAVSTGKRFTAAFLLSVLAWALQVATYQMTARSANFPISTGATVAALLAVNLGFIMRVTPGNVGLFQAAYAATAVAFGLDRGQAVAVALLIQAQQILPVTLLGVFLAPEFILKSKRR